MPHQPPGPPLPDPTQPRPPYPPPPRSQPVSTTPDDLAAQLIWPLGVQCSGTVDCPADALNRTVALIETPRGHYHLLVTANRYTRSRSLWVAWLPHEARLLTLIDEEPEGQIDQALAVIAAHLAGGQPT